MRLALVTDAWAPQVNGVVRTLAATVAELRARGHEVLTLTPDSFRTLPCPSYPEIRLAVAPRAPLGRRLAAFAPDAVHIATEGPLGWAARRWCLDRGQRFTTSFHTRFPTYLAVRTGLPAAWFWPAVRRFHAPADRVLVATERLAAELAIYGINRTHRWSRGVDLSLFSPAAHRPAALEELPRPLLLSVGRVAPEKNLEAFLALPTPGTKVVVGDGPLLAALSRRFPEVRFLGALHGSALAGCYAAADVLVFPSRSDTFGLVMIEALSCGTPVAALPVPGPLDVLGAAGTGRLGRPVGALDQDLRRAIARALGLAPDACMAEAATYSWAACTDQFMSGLSVAEQHRQAA